MERPIMRLFCSLRLKLLKHTDWKHYSQKCTSCDISRIRNIGILAHIDAGKTTTTERMLYFAGKIRSMGEVHQGNTVTDYLEEERRRGITIASVTVCFPWKDYFFNLIDTPGHIDFTMEVEQALSVIDGAVVILDGSTGVEAQTATVWRQADRYSIPRLVYCNKMDRKDASLQLCLDTLKTKFDIQPLVIHIPLYNTKHTLIGLVDILAMEKFKWSIKDQGLSYTKEELTEAVDGQLWVTASKARRELIEHLSDLDDTLAEQIIQEERFDGLSSGTLNTALRRVTMSRKGVPVMCGSSYKNIGVQLLMDAVTHFLPTPKERNDILLKFFENDLCARVFKVIHNEQRKKHIFARIYSGKISKGQKIYNITQQKNEKITNLMSAHADEHEDVLEVTWGNIAVLSGLKHTMMGDLITSTARSAQKMMEEHEIASPAVPVPVFYCSIEPTSQAYQQQLEQALTELQLEDPSLQVTTSPDTGQTILSGMGELHLEIIKNRILSDYKIEVELGPLQIAYKEMILHKVTDTLDVIHKIGTTNHHVRVTMSAWQKGVNDKGNDALLLDHNPDNAANLALLSPRHWQAVKQGIEIALRRGPKLNSPVIDTCIMLHWLEVGRGTSDTIISSVISQCLQNLFNMSGTCILEPVMHMEIVTSAEKLSIVLSDLSRRRCMIQSISSRSNTKVIFTLVPLSEILGYSTDLRMISSGEASFAMEFYGYQRLESHNETSVIKKVMGFLPEQI